MFTWLAPCLLLLSPNEQPDLLVDLDGSANPAPILLRDSLPELLLPFQGGLLFAAEQAEASAQLMWIADSPGSEPVPLTAPGFGEWLQGVDLGNGRALLLQDVPNSGIELFATDATLSGTLALPELSAGPEGSALDTLAVWNARGWFLRQEVPGELELWSTDGTASGFLLEATITGIGSRAEFSRLFAAGGNLFVSTEDASSTPVLYALSQPGGTPQALGPISIQFGSMLQSAIEFNGSLWFEGESAAEGREPWSSDGTLSGTGIAFDLRPGNEGSIPLFFAADANRLWLAANIVDSSSGPFVIQTRELFTIDTAGTATQVADVTPGPGGEDVLDGALLGNGSLLFAVSSELTFFSSPVDAYVSDGTPGGTSLVLDLPDVGPNLSMDWLTPFGGRVAFQANGSAWISNGTPAGTFPVGPESFAPSTLTRPYIATGGFLWWSASSADLGIELIRSGAVSVNDATYTNIAEDQVSGSSNPQGFARLGDRLLFGATPAIGTTELLITDGTPGGTETLDGFQPDLLLEVPVGLALGSNLALDLEESGLTATDGTVSGTEVLASFGPPGSMVFPSGFIPMGEYALFFFDLFDSTMAPLGSGLARTDGTSAGTSSVSSLVSQSFGGPLEDQYIRLGKLLIFAGFEASTGSELWVTDGTPAGTHLLVDFLAGSASSRPSDFVRLGDVVLFTAQDSVGGGSKIFQTDGTTAGTALVADLAPAPVTLAGLTTLGDRVLFLASNPGLGTGLWRTDGTAPGTEFVAPVDPVVSILSTDIQRIGDAVVYNANGSPSFLWRSDGTSAGTNAIPAPPEAGFRPGSTVAFVELGSTGTAVFPALSDFGGEELWLLPADGAAPQPLPEAYPGPGWGRPSDALEFGGRLWFAGTNPVVGREVFSYSLAELGFSSGVTFGSGCSGSGIEPVISYTGGLGLGDVATFRVQEAAPAAAALLFLAVDVDFLDLQPDCLFYLAAPQVLLGTTATDAGGSGELSFPLPNNPGLVGLRLYQQWVCAEAGGPIAGVLASSDALEIVVGP